MGPNRYVRTPIAEDPGEERADHFEEILHPYTREEAILEGQRCLECAMPYCVQACPITQDCRGYNILVGQGKFDKAAQLTLRDNPLATILCKTCYHYCEEDCIMGGRGVPIAIRHLKRAALEFGKSDLLYVPSKPKNQRIAVIGGGPAGLMATWELCLRGYSVTVFEKEPFLGGQMQTIPRYHLDGDEMGLDLARFKNLDCTFVVGKKAGKDFTPESLLKEGYLAVFISVGASDPRALGIPGEELPGVFHALEFLLAANLGEESAFGRKGRKVVVIGGGDVAMDAARSSLRLANKGDVLVVYRRSREDMPAGEEEVTEGEAEGIQFLFSRAPVKITGTEQVEGIVVRQTKLSDPDANGKRKVIEVPGTEETLSCDTVIVAVGEKADLKSLPPELGLKVSAQGWPEGAREDWMTDVDGVFATGGKSIVYAMGAGIKAAETIDAYVSKKTGGTPMPRPDPFGGPTPPPKFPKGYGLPTWHL